MTADQQADRHLRDAESQVGAARTALGLFYGRGDYAGCSTESRVNAGRRALGALPAARRALGEAEAALRREVQTARDEALAADSTRCRVEWPACPDHGNTLSSSGGRTWCRVGSCGREWADEFFHGHCAEPAAYVVADARGGETRLCQGHWIDAQQQLDGARIVARLDGGEV